MLVRAGHPRRQTPSIACAARGTSRGWHARVRTMSSQPPSDVLRELARRYTDLLRSHLSERLVSVVLFGSVARGDASPASDIDLLIVAEDLPQGQFASACSPPPTRPSSRNSSAPRRPAWRAASPGSY